MNTRTILSTVALAAAAAGLAACGSTGGSSASGGYCAELKADKAYFQSFDSDTPDVAGLDKAFDRMHALAASAPPATAADWKTLDHAITSIQSAMGDAGVTFADLAAMQNGDIPDDVDLEALADLAPELETLGGPEVDDAAAAIDEHARHACGFALAAG